MSEKKTKLIRTKSNIKNKSAIKKTVKSTNNKKNILLLVGVNLVLLV